jgi:hypothetical protein
MTAHPFLGYPLVKSSKGWRTDADVVGSENAMNQEQGKTNDTVYEIRIQEHLDERWADWFEGMSLLQQPNGSTILRGPVADQAALHGLLNGIRDLGLSLISVQQEAADGSPATIQESHPEETP